MINDALAAHRQEWAARDFPWCDVCKQPAVFSEFLGFCHSTPEHPFGLPHHLDTSGHEVSIREWNAGPSARPEADR
jgi:hypothetical protein